MEPVLLHGAQVLGRERDTLRKARVGQNGGSEMAAAPVQPSRSFPSTQSHTENLLSVTSSQFLFL